MSQFRSKQAMAITGATSGQLDHWAELGVVGAKGRSGKGGQRLYGLPQLLALRAIRGTLAAIPTLSDLRKLASFVRRWADNEPEADIVLLVRPDGTLATIRSAEIVRELRGGTTACVLHPLELVNDVRSGALEAVMMPPPRRGRPKTATTTRPRRRAE